MTRTQYVTQLGGGYAGAGLTRVFGALQNFAMPLHLACSHSNIDPGVVRFLLERCPTAASYAGEVSAVAGRVVVAPRCTC